MFQHLPVITESNLKVVLEKEMDYFTDLLSQDGQVIIISGRQVHGWG